MDKKNAKKNSENKFAFEHEKPNPGIAGHVSTPENVSKLLVELLGNKERSRELLKQEAKKYNLYNNLWTKK